MPGRNLAILGWSPNLRALLDLKRESDCETDETQDGARAVFAEDGQNPTLT